MIKQKNKLGYLLLVVLCVAFHMVQNATPASAIPSGFKGGDGKSIGSAVIIPYIGDYERSTDQEYKYISALFGQQGHGWVLQEQELIKEKDRFYDKVTIKILFSKEIVSLFFDITEPHAALKQHLTHIQ